MRVRRFGYYHYRPWIAPMLMAMCAGIYLFFRMLKPLTETLKPGTPDELCEAVRWAVAEKAPLEVFSAGTKRSFGRPVEADHQLDLCVFAGIGLYEAEELVLAVGAIWSNYVTELTAISISATTI